MVGEVGPVDYEVSKPGHRWECQICHINLRKEKKMLQGWMALHEEEDAELGPSCLELRASKIPEVQAQFREELTAEQQ